MQEKYVRGRKRGRVEISRESERSAALVLVNGDARLDDLTDRAMGGLLQC